MTALTKTLVLVSGLLLAVSSAALPAGTARAQTLSFAVSGAVADPATPPAAASGRITVGVSNARVDASRVDLALGYDTGAGAAQLDFAVQANETFGPVGNVVGEGRVSMRTDAQAQGALGVRGVVGPVALGVRLSAFTADPARFDPLAVGGDTRPDFGAGGFAASLSASGRPARTVVLEADPQVYIVPDGVAARATARARFLRALGRNELSVRALGYLAPHGRAADGALGVGLTVKRRSAPDLDGALYLGWSRRGLRPGATASLGQQLGPVDASLTVAAEPFRVDVPPYRASLGIVFPVGPGTAQLSGAGAMGPAGLAGSLQVRYAVPVTLPR